MGVPFNSMKSIPLPWCVGSSPGCPPTLPLPDRGQDHPKTPQIPLNKDHKTPNRATLGCNLGGDTKKQSKNAASVLLMTRV